MSSSVKLLGAAFVLACGLVGGAAGAGTLDDVKKNGVLRFVEVKSEADEPSAEQNRMFKLLSRYTGITVEIRRPTSAASLADRQEAMKLKNYAAYRAIRPR